MGSSSVGMDLAAAVGVAWEDLDGTKGWYSTSLTLRKSFLPEDLEGLDSLG